MPYRIERKMFVQQSSTNLPYIIAIHNNGEKYIIFDVRYTKCNEYKNIKNFLNFKFCEFKLQNYIKKKKKHNCSTLRKEN